MLINFTVHSVDFNCISDKMRTSFERRTLVKKVGRQKETWHHETIEFAGTDMARINNVAPVRKGGNRETCFILFDSLIVAF